MRKNLSLCLFTLMAIMPLTLFGQSTLRTPYSQYGVGELQSDVFATQQAMGGTGIGIRIPNLINMANPASLTAQDTNSFVFDVGVNYKASQYEQNNKMANHFTSNINHLAASFPILAHRWYSSFALLPYSKMGYSNTVKTNYIPLTPEDKTYEGSGGLARFNWSNGVVITKNISLGISASYLFGSLTKTNTISYPFESSGVSNTIKKSMIVGDFYFNYGAQYHTTREKDNFVVGLTFQNQSKVKARYDELFLKQFAVTDYVNRDRYGNPLQYTIADTIVNTKGSNSHILLPTCVGLGFSWNREDKFILGIETNFEKWSSTTILGEKANLKDKIKINAGFQFTPDPHSFTSYINRIHYRVGTYYTQSELELRGKRINDYGVSAGLGIPFMGGKSTFNLSYQYGIRGTTSNGLLSEKYSLVCFGFSFYDIWFVKRRLS